MWKRVEMYVCVRVVSECTKSHNTVHLKGYTLGTVWMCIVLLVNVRGKVGRQVGRLGG